ncbi:hypothetical protein [Amycolatopsis sp. NPDC004079]|uniref:hypothetical protein n=1 Tax=Amycolatopsis sp. NPDC004079 TaxID=3154549 RepID=UPI0033A36832
MAEPGDTPREAAARRDPSKADFSGRIVFSLKNPTTAATGQRLREVALTANTIDSHAEEFFGGHQCHRLAGALNFLTGWDVTVFDILRDGSWEPVHSAVRTPEGDVLDIHGRATLSEAYRRLGVGIRHRTVPVEDMPGDVMQIRGLNGDRLWWAAEGPIAMTAAFMHFARLLLRNSGYDATGT